MESVAIMRGDVERDALAAAFVEFRAATPDLKLDLGFRVAEAADEAFLDALYSDQRAREFAGLPLAGPALATLIGMQRRAQSIGYRQQFPQAVYLIICCDNEPVGRLTVDRIGAAPTGRFLHVVDIALLGRVRGRGFGRAVMEAVIGVADAIDVPGVGCTVARSNHVMRQLTAGLSFRPIADDGEAPFLALRRDRLVAELQG